MRKRRTRKQKERAKYGFMLQKSLSSSKTSTTSHPVFLAKKDEAGSRLINQKTDVKGQIRIKRAKYGFRTRKSKLTKYKAKPYDSASVKHNITKSLVQAGIILTLELVLYLYLEFRFH